MKLKLAALALATLAVAMPAHARKDAQTWPIAPVLALPDYAAKVGDFKFVFGDKVSGAQLGSTTTRRTTNGFGKKDQDACNWAMLSALIALKADAIAKGGTSVQGLKSTVTGTPFSSATEFQCLSGVTNSRVYLDGVVVK